jgi:O-glycosyl hydrolase
MAKAARKDLDAHEKALAGRPDNGRYSKKTTADIAEQHNKKIKDAAYDDYQKERKKYVEETVNPKKRFKLGRLKQSDPNLSSFL